MRSSRSIRSLTSIALCCAVACGGAEPRRDVAPDTAATANPASAAWYRGERTLDLTGDGRADTVRLQAVGADVDSLRVRLSIVVDGVVQHETEWESSYELALVDSATRARAGAESILRAKLDTVLASVAVRPFGSPGASLMAEDSSALAGIEPRPTHEISFSYGYETTVRLAWDAPRNRFIALWSCC